MLICSLRHAKAHTLVGERWGAACTRSAFRGNDGCNTHLSKSKACSSGGPKLAASVSAAAAATPARRVEAPRPVLSSSPPPPALPLHALPLPVASPACLRLPALTSLSTGRAALARRTPLDVAKAAPAPKPRTWWARLHGACRIAAAAAARSGASKVLRVANRGWRDQYGAHAVPPPVPHALRCGVRLRSGARYAASLTPTLLSPRCKQKPSCLLPWPAGRVDRRVVRLALQYRTGHSGRRLLAA